MNNLPQQSEAELKLRNDILQILAEFKEGDEDYQSAADKLSSIVDRHTSQAQAEARINEQELSRKAFSKLRRKPGVDMTTLMAVDKMIRNRITQLIPERKEAIQ